MRLWTFHPAYLDAKGLVAAWREALLARAVLTGHTRGYRHHPQLTRFRSSAHPKDNINRYLIELHKEAEQRNYRFDDSKLVAVSGRSQICETEGQLLYEWRHFHRKLAVRDRGRHRELQVVSKPRSHPLFKIVPGGVKDWEKRP